MNDALLAEAQALVEEATSLGLSFGFAESCTAGLVSQTVGSVPGASAAFAGAVVSYMLSVKERVLGVSSAVLDDPTLGAVSAECAIQMARGAREVLDTNVAVSVTGIAGPTGAEPGKPVGTVWFGLSTAFCEDTRMYHFEGSRDEVREQAALVALMIAREGLMKASIPDKVF